MAAAGGNGSCTRAERAINLSGRCLTRASTAVDLIAVALAVIVLAFSLTDQQGAAGTNLAPDAFNGGHAYATMTALAARYPSRRPGSPADYDIASTVARELRQNGFMVSTSLSKGRTAVGTRTLETVTGDAGRAVERKHRDRRPPRLAAFARGGRPVGHGRAARAGAASSRARRQHRSVVLASTSGTIGQAGAIALADHLAKPGRCGDRARRSGRAPTSSSPWSSRGRTVLVSRRRCCATRVAAALTSQTGLRPGGDQLRPPSSPTWRSR